MSAPHRAGVVALLGVPNAGKSTLLNRLVGQKLAIVTPKPQTTRSRILGILTLEGAQVLLVDTPGRHVATHPLNQALNAQVVEAVRDCDVALLLVDPRRGLDAQSAALAAEIRSAGRPLFAVATKCDRAEAAEGDWPPPEFAYAAAFRVSARTGEGIETLLDAIVGALPASPPFYPEDDLTDRSLRWLAAELVREAAFRELAQELPYQVAVEVERFDESRADVVEIRAQLLVARESQKRIVIGAGGQKVKQIGIRARREIERLVGRKVHLELWVKPDRDWDKRPKRLNALGYH